MKLINKTVMFCSLAGVVALSACGGSTPPEAVEGDAPTEGEIGAEVAPPSPEAVAAAERLTARLANREAELISTQRGAAGIEYTQPQARRQQDFIVTNFLVRNNADNAIAGFQVDEFWFDVDGNTVTGDSVRFPQPIAPQEVVAIELRVPRNPAMDRSNYEFSHQNGEIEPELVDELPEPEEEETEEPTDEPAD